MQILLTIGLIFSWIFIGILIFLVIKGKGVTSADIKHAVSSTWIELGLGEKVEKVASHAEEIKKSYESFEQMLRVPKERAALGEIALETILSDQLPPDMYGIREAIINGKKPDAYIRSPSGIICIDSKFPLDNYGKMLEIGDSVEKQNFKKAFLRDVKDALDKIADDYICPDKGTTGFAFAYIPSESVYYFLIHEEYDMLREYTKKGVQVVSPLTLTHKIELVKAGVHAKKLSEEAEKVRRDLIKISEGFNQIDEKWRTFYDTHLKNAVGKAWELDEAYKKLREEFTRVSKISEE